MSGCDGATGLALKIEFETTLAAYAPGDSVVARLTNYGSTEVYYNFCGSRLHAFIPPAWRDTGEPEVVCTRQAFVLAPGATVERWIGVLPHGLEPGQYRFATDLGTTTVIPQIQRAATKPFTVAP